MKHTSGTLNQRLYIFIIGNSTPKQVQELLQLGADPNAVVSPEISQFLAKKLHFLPEESQNWLGNSPLQVATKFGRFEKFKLLLENGANPTFIDRNGYTALDLAVASSNFYAHPKDYSFSILDIFVILLNPVRNLKILYDGFTKNYIDKLAEKDPAVYNEMTQILLKSGAPVRQKHLLEAGLFDNHILLPILCKNCREINGIHNRNGTPLHILAMANKTQACEILLANGADLCAKNQKGLTPLDCAKIAGAKESTRLLEEKMKKQPTKNTAFSRAELFYP